MDGWMNKPSVETLLSSGLSAKRLQLEIYESSIAVEKLWKSGLIS
jgi:hypothetical protein